MIGVEQRTTAEVLAPLQDDIGELHERWADKTLEDVYAEKPISEHVEVTPGHHVEAVTLEPSD